MRPFYLSTKCLELGLIAAALATRVNAQDTIVVFTYPAENQIALQVSASVGADGSMRKYQYNIQSLISSIQKVWEFSIFNVPSYDSSKTPVGWDVDASVIPSQRLTWASSDSSYDIPPGNARSGLAIVSRGLPCIRDYYARGYIDVPSVSIEPDSIVGGRFPENAYHGITIGPGNPPHPFRALVFIDTIKAFVNQARSLSWIADQPTSDKYTNYLNTVRSQLQSANLSAAGATLLSIISSTSSDSTIHISSEAYALIRFNTQYLLTQIQPSSQVKGGIFNPQATSTLSVRAKPDSSFTSSDTLIALTATVRWQSRYSSITLGTVSSPIYGFTAYGSVVTQGNYKYQTFRTTTHVPLNWTAGSEYELFTVPVNGSAGVEDFALTNALSAGQWFVDIDYLDKTDSVFYQPVVTCTGITSQNKADNSASTAFNGPRHLAKTSTKLHEVYNSGGQIVYRRKDLSGSWEVTKRISFDSLNSQNDPSLIVAHDGSIHIVWQQLLTSTSYAVWYVRSTDGGTSWSRPDTLLRNIPIVQNQWNVYPVIAEYGTTQLVVVWCTGNAGSTGLQYRISSNLGQTWTTVAGLTSSGTNTWYPSLAPASNYLMLTYDGRYNGVFSRIYNGAWQPEVSVSNGDGMYSDGYSSVAVDPYNQPLAAWCAQSTGHYEYTIVYRSGYSNGAWGSGFVQFAVDAPGVHDLYPSVTYDNRGGLYGVNIIYTTTTNLIKSEKFTYTTWSSPLVLSSSGQWPNSSIANQTTSPGEPINVWSDQSGSPYQVVLQSDGNYSFQKVAAPSVPTTDLHRRIVVEGQRSGSTIWFDLAPLKVVTSSNDTVAVPFKILDLTKPFVATITNAWDYLGTDQLTLPSNARSLILETDIESFAKRDSLSSNSVNSFTSSSFRVDGIKASQTLPFVSSQASTSGKTVIDVTSQAGQTITLRMVGTVPAASAEPVTIGVGDVYIARKQ